MKTVFFDVDTQLDFVFPAGALHVPGAENIVENLGKLTRFAAAQQYQIISTADAHTEDDPEFKIWKPHCVAGTVGQQKCAGTLLAQMKVLDSDLTIAPQILVEKQKLDCFTNPNLRPLLTKLAADRYFVYGVVSEYCVKCAAMGLLELGVHVELVTDAIQTLDPSAERAFVTEFKERNGHLTTTGVVIGS